MLTIYKYPFRVDDAVTIDLPRSAKLLKVEAQHGTPCLWALVDTDEPVESRRFHVFGTGNPIGDDQGVGDHVATFQQGPFVWHLFEDLGVESPS
jgi:hypothetical protein